jgi:hypothetical protein
MDILSDMTNNVLPGAGGSVHGAAAEIVQIFRGIRFGRSIEWNIFATAREPRTGFGHQGSKSEMDERTLSAIEKQSPGGLTSAEILDLFARHDIPLSEATLRKYVQLGLLPRSVRVGRKGKHQGSQGVYPVNVVRQIVTIKRMMAEDMTIERIARDFLFIRNDMAELERTLSEIFEKLDNVLREQRLDKGAAVQRDVIGARAMSRDLVARLEAIEEKLGKGTKMEKLTAS